ncbi:hypothetical protein TetV_659 [Tetraselmis virus 1]|uniref:Uncharacterized protein n=1 Tax=Tetraselmis virus 1 TaxID=2060617 RepID=A0A2P0VPC2_9VIRU|nr:hypothetical protein QJ968_gp395 [Tetraselmis virus 1]AUF82741.1 hypothetical protein TetV_659 [Tetraselmis virus 1]
MSVYDTLSPTGDQVSYTEIVPSVDYSLCNIESFQSVQTPKIDAFELDVLELSSYGKFAFTFSNEHSLDIDKTLSSLVLKARNDNDIGIENESGNAFINMTSSGNINIEIPDSSIFSLAVEGSNVLQVYKTNVIEPSDNNVVVDNKVKIDGDLDISGLITSGGSLYVGDKVINLVHNSDSGLPEDGSANDGSGLVIDGIPSTGNSSFSERYEKSIRWFHGDDGMPSLGGSNLLVEPYWEVKGAGMRWTYIDPDTGEETSFGFRINDEQEFELYKRTKVGADERFNRITKFG